MKSNAIKFVKSAVPAIFTSIILFIQSPVKSWQKFLFLTFQFQTSFLACFILIIWIAPFRNIGFNFFWFGWFSRWRFFWDNIIIGFIKGFGLSCCPYVIFCPLSQNFQRVVERSSFFSFLYLVSKFKNF